jgi:hypothetical protein
MIAKIQNSDKDVGLSLMFDRPGVEVLSSPGIARDWLRFFTWAVTVMSVGYYRVYADGAASHPLVLLVGGLTKLGVACMLAEWHASGRARAGVALGYVPDFVLGLYFLKVYWADLAGSTTAMPRAKQG